MRTLALIAALGLSGTIAFAQETPSNPDAELYFVNLADGDKIAGPVTVGFGLKGMGVAPSGIEKEGTGHHHLLVNRAKFGEGEYGTEEFELAFPTDENHLHFGGGQTEVTLELAPGTHTLQLVLGDAGHVPHDPPVASEQITIVVE